MLKQRFSGAGRGLSGVVGDEAGGGGAGEGRESALGKASEEALQVLLLLVGELFGGCELLELRGAAHSGLS